ncbi:ATP-binding cassette domain-containing protein [Lactococcus hircilactis]|uniref:ATP-binding cassette domain-containing protein n=1 Tax=Lactococcus hircilactis TaxID=1494462 RepID=A0A7X2D133_9LACT|nr:ABC transporter ATP-binding protein [Lactococcus hircilactis]MQW38680.1 ATP-binding cassette domain-containing protein [Lactococcus hircilactis]
MTDFSNAEPVLEIKNLSVDYGFTESAAHVLRGVNLTLHEGEVLGLAGESGCGKSTLVYGATRLLPPPGLITGGEVWIKGTNGERRDLLKLTDKALREQRWVDEAVVFQGAMNSLNPVYRVGHQIKDAIQAHRPDWDKQKLQNRAVELMDMVGISPDRLESFPHQLSGGMRQRVMIAMALALEPKVLIMDEPTTALDVVMQRQIVQQITDLRKKLGFAVIFITHDMSLLIEIADRIAIMYAGQIIEDGPAMDLYNHARHPYTRGLINSFPPLHGPRRELGGIPGTPPDMATLGDGCPFADRCAYVHEACHSYEVSLKETGLLGDRKQHVVGCLLYEELKKGKGLPEALAKERI